MDLGRRGKAVITVGRLVSKGSCGSWWRKCPVLGYKKREFEMRGLVEREAAGGEGRGLPG